MPTTTSITPDRPVLDMGFRPARPEHILARMQNAFRLKTDEPVISVVTEQMLSLAPHIDLVGLKLRYPEPEEKPPEGRVDMLA